MEHTRADAESDGTLYNVELGLSEPVSEGRCQALRNFWHKLTADTRLLQETLGTRLLLWIVLVEIFFKAGIYGGGSGGLMGLPILFILRSYGTMDAVRIQTLKSVALLPWSCKPLMGMISDALYIGGYNKLPYIALTTVLCIYCCIMIAAAWPLTAIQYILLMMFVFLHMALTDLLTEAKYAEKTNLFPRIGPVLISFQYNLSFGMQILCIVLSGALIQYLSLHYIYLLPLLPLLFTLWPLYNNWLQDVERLETEESPLLRLLPWRWCLFSTIAWRSPSQQAALSPPTSLVALDWERIRQNKRLFGLAVLIFVVSIVNAVLCLFQVPTRVLFITALLGALVMIIGFYYLVPPVVAKIQIFVILQNMFTLSIDSAGFFFCTDTVEQYPEGPHFSVFFYVTVLSCMACVLGLMGTLSYRYLLAGWKYRPVFLFTNLLYVAVSMLNVLFYLRWNRKVGIPDELFVLGGETLQAVSAVWTFLPASVMMLTMCPPGVEAVMYSLLAGSSNLGGMLASYQGAFLLEMLNITPSGAVGETRAFDNLWLAALISNLIPLVPLISVFWLIPDAHQDQPILQESDCSESEQEKRGDGHYKQHGQDEEEEAEETPSVFRLSPTAWGDRFLHSMRPTYLI
jgi:hypothetical protein